MSEHHKSPVPSKDQEYPEQERMVTPDEEAGQDIAEMEHPPQAEGERDEEDEEGKAGRSR